MTDSAQAAPAAKPPYEARDPKPLGKAVVVWLWAHTAALAANLAATGWYLVVLAALSPSEPMGWLDPTPGGETVDGVVGLVAIATFLIWVVCAVLILRWIYRVVKNARILTRGHGVDSTPGWAVGWYFIPIANLWKPFKPVEEAWQASEDPANPAGVDTPGRLRWWWGLWLVMNVLGNLAGRLSMRGQTAGDAAASSTVQVAADLVNIPLNLVFIAIVMGLSRRQSAALNTRAFE